MFQLQLLFAFFFSLLESVGKHEASSLRICYSSDGRWWHVTHGDLGDYYLGVVKILFS